MSRQRSTVPIFPLPDVVLFPETRLPLHIFEPRYRTLLADALAGDRIIGIQLLRTELVSENPSRPAVFEIGCAGEIVDHEPQEDGTSNIVLEGLYRYRIESELPGTVYRRAEVTTLPIEPLPDRGLGIPSRRELRHLLVRVVSRLALSVGRPEASELQASLSDEGLVNEALSRLGLDTEDRYRLLSMDRLEERYAWVVGHIGAIQERLDLLAPYRRKGELDPRLN